MDQRQGQARQASETLRRRGLLAAIAAVVAGGLAKASERVAQAGGTQGTALIDGEVNTATNPTQLNGQPTWSGQSVFVVDGTSVGARAIVGTGGAAAGVQGILGAAASTTGSAGVQGSSSSSPGVRGDSDTSTGVFGYSGGLYGVEGSGPVGVFGQTAANGGVGVSGAASSGVGVHGGVDTSGTGVRGDGNNNQIGVLGVSASQAYQLAAPGQPAAVYGLASASIPGVVGQSNSGNGVYGASVGNVGVLGTSSASHGLYGASTSGYGLYATSTNSTGIVSSTNGGNAIQGASNGNVGVLGTSNSSIGGYFSSGTSTGLYATGPGAGFAARFDGPVQVNGAFTVLGGPKSAAVPHPDGSYRRLYCTEAPESWFEDFGRAQLVNGQARVPLDADFAALVHADSYQVFAFPEGDCNGLYVSGRTAAGFEVRELKGGTSTLPFSYRLVAKRKDLAGPRLEKVEVAAVPPRPAAPQPPPPILRLEPPVSDPNARPPQRQP